MSIKLEAFFKIPVQYNEYTVEKNICENGHKVKKTDLYCTKCGEKIIKTTHVLQCQIKLSEILCGSLLNEGLFEVIIHDYMYVFSYYNTKSSIGIKNTVITPELISSIIGEFSEQNEKTIRFLEDKLNLKIKVEFGYFPEY